MRSMFLCPGTPMESAEQGQISTVKHKHLQYRTLCKLTFSESLRICTIIAHIEYTISNEVGDASLGVDVRS